MQMKPCAFLGLLAGLVLHAGCGSPSESPAPGLPGDQQPPPTNSSVVANELIVAVAPGADSAAVDELVESAGGSVRDRLADLSVLLVQVDDEDRDRLDDALGDSPLVEGTVDNNVFTVSPIPTGPAPAKQWHLDAIDARAAWELTRGDVGIVVAVLDTGIDADHPDLAGQIVEGADTLVGGAGWEDRHGHGTAVAGIIAAAANADGLSSLAPDCRLLAVRVADESGASTSWSIAAGIGLAVNRGAKVINVSLAPMHHDEIVLRQAELARLRGALVVFAAGNEGERVTGGGSDGAIFVSGLTDAGERAPTSSFGDFIDLGAPGVAIYTSTVGGGYGAWTGTSFAAPIVSGVAALVWSERPELRPATVKGILLATADDVAEPGDDEASGAGQVNALGAVELARGIVEQADTTPPTVKITQPGVAGSAGGVFNVTATVTDDGDVSDVTLAIDGVPYAQDTLAPYSFVVDSSRFSVGEHNIAVIATDFAGNTGQAAIRVRLTGQADIDPPEVSIISPEPGSLVRGVITILADVRDDRNLALVEALVDGAVIETVTPGAASARVAVNWDSEAASVSAGEHELAVRAVDASGSVGRDSIRIIVQK